eukprot:6479779-Amphidinium_carterae.1
MQRAESEARGLRILKEGSKTPEDNKADIAKAPQTTNAQNMLVVAVMSTEKHEGSKAKCQATEEPIEHRIEVNAEPWIDRWQHGVRLPEADESRRVRRQVSTERQTPVEPRSSYPNSPASWIR